jgi:hypothetical protein
MVKGFSKSETLSSDPSTTTKLDENDIFKSFWWRLDET